MNYIKSVLNGLKQWCNVHRKVLMIILLIFIMIIVVCISYYMGKSNVEKVKENEFFYKDGFRYKVISAPKDYFEFTDLRWCYTDNVSYTNRYYLFELYEFQKMSPNERIERFLSNAGMDEYNFRDNLGKFMEIGKTYKIADDYCITMDENASTIKTNCNSGAKSIFDLPSERCIAFGQHDDKGIYWNSYKSELWKEFNKLGIDGINREIENEKDIIAEKCKRYRPLDY